MGTTADGVAATADGRDTAGRFAKGNKGGPGRPRRASEVNYLLAVTEVVSVDRWRWIIEFIAGQADKGDLKAAAWLGKILLGASPGALSEALAGVVRDGPHFRVAEALAKREEADDLDDFDEDDRDMRVAELVHSLGDPDGEDGDDGGDGDEGP